MLKPDKTVYLIGAEGFVGSYVLEHLKKRSLPVITTTQASLDITDHQQLAVTLSALQPNDVVILAAAAPNVDWCETNQDKSAAVNAYAPEAIAKLSAEHQARLIFFSSEYVFDGTAGPYSEEDTPHPLNVYGRHKLQAEQAIQKYCPNSLSVRTTTVYGYEETRKNFLMSFIDRIRNKANVLVPEDQLSTPTYVDDLARITVDLAIGAEAGIIHVTGAEVMPRTQLAQQIAKAFELPSNSWQGVATDELHQVAKRPLRAGLRTEKLQQLGYTTHSVTEALKTVKHTYGRLI